MSVALIAGEGSLPREIASRMSDAGDKPIIYAMRENNEELLPYAREVLPLFRTDIASTLRDIAMRGARKVMFAGVIPKTLMYRPAMMDDMAKEFIDSLGGRDDHSILGGIVSIFERAGFEVIGYRELISDLMASSGHIAGRTPTEAEKGDIDYGIGIARTVLPLSFGQTIIVSKRAVVAVEAMEGTDVAILRAGSLCSSGVIVKMIKQGQDARYDLPTVGTQTLHLMVCAGLTCLALQSAWTLILNRDEFADLAEKENIAVVGIDY